MRLGALARAEARTRIAARCLRRANRAARNYRAAEVPEVRRLFGFEATGLTLRARDNLELGLLQITSSLKELLGDVLDAGEAPLARGDQSAKGLMHDRRD